MSEETSQGTDQCEGLSFLEDNARCPEPCVDGHRRCILHLSEVNKNRDLFWRTFEAKRARGDYDFRGVVFAGLVTFSDDTIHGLADFERAVFYQGAVFRRVSFRRGVSFKSVTSAQVFSLLDATIAGVVDFSDANFEHDVRFDSCTFVSQVLLERARFGGEVRCTSSPGGTVFAKGVFAADALFKRRVEFWNIIISGLAAFERAEFEQDVLFVNCAVEDANFQSARFAGLVSFLPARRGPLSLEQTDVAELPVQGPRFGRSRFSSASFTDQMTFSGVEFEGETRFEDCQFLSVVSFVGLRFREGNSVIFDGSAFSARASFGDVLFEGRTSFSSVTFERDVTFVDCRFRDEVAFQETQFKGAALFRPSYPGDITFGNTASFHGSTFAGRCEFVALGCNGDLLFADVRFQRPAKFENVDCHRSVSFVGATFAEGQLIAGSSFRSEHGVFLDCSMAGLAGVMFRDISMENVRLRGALGLGEAEFLSVRWASVPERGLLPTRRPTRRGVVRDELEARDVKSAAAYEDAERIYRQLRQSHTARADAPRVGDFYAGEMAMRRRAGRARGRRLMLEDLYWAASNYGEDWLRPLEARPRTGG